MIRGGGSISARFILLGGSHILGAVLGFLATLIAVRALGDSGYGAVAIGLSLQTYAFVLVSFGTELHAVQQTARAPETLNRVLARTTLLRLALSVPTFLLLVGLALSGIWGPEESLVIGCFSISVFFQAMYPLWAPQALERVGLVAVLTLFGHVVILGLTAIVAGLEAGPWAFAAAKVVSDLLLAIVTFLWTRRKARAEQWRPRLQDVIAEAREVMPLAVAQLLRSAMILFDIVVLSLFVTAAAVGQFAVAFRIYLFILSIGSIYFVIVLPIFAKRMNEGLTALRQELRASLIRTIPVTLVGIAAVLVIAEPLLARLFGAEFVTAAPALKILMIAIAANYLHRTYRQVLLVTDSRRVDLRDTVTAVILKFAAMLLLVPMYGMFGAAVAAVFGELVLLFVQRRAALRVLASG